MSKMTVQVPRKGFIILVLAVLAVGVSVPALLADPPQGIVPHRITTFRANTGGYVGDFGDAEFLSDGHDPTGAGNDWPQADPATIDPDGLPAVLDVPYGLPTPPALPGGDSGYQALPEPGSLLLLVLGGTLALRRRR